MIVPPTVALVRTRTPLAAAVDDLVGVLRRIHAERGVAGTAGIAPALAVQDVSEMLGNLFDNGWRHARSRVRVTAGRDGALVRIVVEDDGHGFGLSITRELAEPNGGSLTLERSVGLGGLRVVLMLPAPIGDWRAG